MPHLAHRLAGLILGLSLLIPHPSFAQDAPTQPAGADAWAVSRTPMVKSIKAGDIRAELLTAPEGTELTAGGTAFAQLTLFGDVSGKRGGAAAELLIDAAQGEIVAVEGSGIKVEGAGNARRIKVDGLSRKQSRTLLVEMRLPASPSGQAALKVALRQVIPSQVASSKVSDGASPVASPASAEIAWRIGDCVGGYYGALQKIRGDAQSQLTQRWREAAKGDAALSRSWLFPAKEERRRTRRARPHDTQVTSAMPKRREREILAEAGKLVRAGKDPALASGEPVGWVLGKVAADLDSYLAQPRNPALCTGASALADWYSGRLGDVAQRGNRLGQFAADARLLAREKTESTLSTARALPAEAPVWGGLTPVAVKDMAIRDESLKGLAVTLAELAAIAPEALGRVRQAPTAYDALIQIRDAGFETAGMAEAVRTELRAALGAIDAAARLEIASARHAEIQRAFEGRIKAIREAYSAHCLCQS